ncbi:MAG: glutamate--tRNA ligase [Patescibacteria group bacterium]
MFFALFHKKSKIRTRFAPSPTGYLHVGGLRTALYGYLTAKQSGGNFVVRIEDTDQTREVAGAVEDLLKSLKWAGLEPDEGVFLDKKDKIAEKGKFGPYRQSKRVAIYQKYAQKLVDSRSAYYCFCSPERLENLRQEQQAQNQPTKYDGRCLGLTPDEIKEKLKNGEPRVIRMKIPAEQTIEFNDLIRGKVKFNSHDIDDQILIKSDGFPTYHLASVVDDHLMKITQIIRGEEWLSSTPKHILLYQYFGWTPPEFAHLPLLLNPNKSKLSKRQGDAAVEDYRAQGYLPEAVINFVALLGWNPGLEQEIFSLAELIKIFDLKMAHRAGAIFNLEKLDWLNGEYIKKLSIAKFAELAKPFLEKNEINLPADLDLNKILKLEQQRISHLNELGQGIGFLLTENLKYEPQILIWKKSNKETALKCLEMLATELDKYGAEDWSQEKLQIKISEFIKTNNLNNGEVLWPMRVALTGLEKSPTPFEIAEILGQKKTLKRLRTAMDLLR